MSLGNALRNREEFVPPKLQITAMMDMFTIIVFFLLFSYADRPDEIQLTASIDLPVSTAQRDYDNTVKVFLSSDEVKIEDEVVAKISRDIIVGYNPKQPQESTIYKTLEKIRQERLSKQESVSENAAASPAGSTPESDVAVEGKPASERNKPQILFFCDKSVPFKVINTVMKTIGMVGYPNMQFAVTGES